MLSKEEWRRAAELAAAAEDGRKHASWLRFKRFGAAPAGILVAVGAAGLGAWWMFAHVVSPLFSGSGPHVAGRLPIGFVLVSGVALIGTIAAFRVRYPSAMFLIARAIGAVFIWLGLLTYAVTVLVA